jgi:hypothetical protein
MNRERQVTLKDLKEMNDDALVQLLGRTEQRYVKFHRRESTVEPSQAARC